MKINLKVKTKRNPAATPNAGSAEVDPFRAQHMTLTERVINTAHGAQSVTMDDAESPLAWLARRRGRDGRAMIAPHQLQAGERLRSDFTRAHMMPRTTRIGRARFHPAAAAKPATAPAILPTR